VNRIIERVAAIPGVTAAGMVNRLPLAGGMSMAMFEFDAPRVHPDLAAVDMRVATPDYFTALGIPVLEGRAFDGRDTPQSTPVGIVDERIAKLVWPGESAIGKRFRMAPHLMKSPWYEIVGVVGHIRHDALDVDARAQTYWSADQVPMDRMALVVRADRDAAALSGSVVGAIHEIDPEQPVYDVRTMDDVVDRSLGQRWMNMTLVVTFAGVSLLLCMAGVYGVIAFGVTQQGREFGIRLALGATRSSITRDVVRRGIGLAAVGIAIGAVLAAAVVRSMESMLFGVRSTDAASFVISVLVLLGMAAAASALPARRAGAVDPAVTLRSE
jgi:predicted permease